MVIINAEPWTPKGESYEGEGSRDRDTADSQRRDSQASLTSVKKTNLFAIHDLANDYIHTFSEKGRPKICRIIWAVILMTVIGISIYLIYTLLVDYFMYNSFNQSTTTWKDNITLPAISICSTNYVNYTALTEELSKTEESKKLLGYYNNFAKSVAQFDKRGDLMQHINLEEGRELVSWEIEAGFLNIRFKNDIRSMLVGESDYTFQGWGRKIMNFAKVSHATELGTCLELNDDGKFIQSYSGVNGGLTFDIDANVQDYLPTTKTKGFVLFIRDQSETVMLNSGGYVIAPGTEAFVKLSMRNITRLGGNYGTCKNVPSQYSRHGTHYETIRECTQKQKISAMLDECMCVPWYVAERLYNTNKTDVLDKMVVEVEKAIAELATDPPPESGDNQTSTKRKRDLTHTLNNLAINDFTLNDRTMYNFDELVRAPQKRNADGRDENAEETTPTPQYTSTPIKRTEAPPTPAVPLFKSDYRKHVCGFVFQIACDSVLQRSIKRGSVLKKCPEPCAYKEFQVDMTSTVFPPTNAYLQNIMKFGGKYAEKPPTFEYARENIARIHIYYDDIKVDEVAQEAAYDWASFVGELGGIGDLFVGFSFFTLFQLIEILIAYTFRCAQNAYQKRQEKKEEAQNVAANTVALRDLSVTPSPPRDTESDPSQVKTEHAEDPVYELSNI